MPDINQFRQIAARQPEAARIRLANEDGQDQLAARGKKWGKVARAFTKDSKLQRHNDRVIQAFTQAIFSKYGTTVGAGIFANHISGMLQNHEPLSSRKIQTVLDSAQNDLSRRLATGDWGHDVNELRTMLAAYKAERPERYEAFMQAKLSNATLDNAQWTELFLACPDPPAKYGAAANMNKLQLPTVQADLAASDANRKDETVTKFRDLDPNLSYKYGVFSAPPAANLGPLVTLLNQSVNDVLFERVDRPNDRGAQPIANAVRQLSLQLNLTSTQQNTLLRKLGDKIATGDVNETALLAELNGGNQNGIFQVAAEILPANLVDQLVRGLNVEDKLSLIGACFGRGGSYRYFKEGPDRIVQSLLTDPATDAAIKTTIGELKSGFVQSEAFEQAVREQNPTTTAQLNQLLTPLRGEATERVTTMRDNFNAHRQTLRTALQHHLGSLPPGGTVTPAQFRAATGLTVAQAQRLVPLLNNPVDVQTMTQFAHLFGSSVTVPNAVPSASQPNEISPDAAQQLAHIALHLDGLSGDGQVFLDGLSKMSMILPTAGKPLEDLTFLRTMANEIQAARASMAANLRPSADDFPMIVFDQSPPGRLATNQQYCRQLAQDTGTRIEVITMAEVMQLGTKLGIPGMFDTAGGNYAGYGGARNISNLLGPLIDDAFKSDPPLTVNDLLAMPNQQLLARFQQVSLGNNRMILMGDDDASVMPGFIHSKAVLADFWEGQYVTAKSHMFGRDSTAGGIPNQVGVHELTHNELSDQTPLVGQVLGSVAWQPYENMAPVMAAALSHPGACLNLPCPTEEGHFAVYDSVSDKLSRTLHHAGDRFEDFGTKAAGYLGYTQEGALVDTLLDCGGNFENSELLPWNHEDTLTGNPTRTLGDIMDFAGQQQTQRNMQVAFFQNLSSFETNNRIAPLVTTDYGAIFDEAIANQLGLTATQRHELTNAKQGYLRVQADMNVGLEFRNRLFAQLESDFGNVPVASRNAAWNSASNGSQLDKINFLIGQGHNIALAADNVRNAMVADPNSEDPSQSRLARTVFLTAKSIGGGQFNEHARAMTA